MKTIRIFCFSGTGNTTFVVEALQKALNNDEYLVDTYPLEQLYHATSAKDIMNVDLIGIAFPVHAFNPPWLVEAVFKKIELPRDKKYFIIKTAGDTFALGGSTFRLQNILRKHYWRLQYEALVPMPANIFIRYQDDFIKLNAKMAILQAEKIASDLIKGIKHKLPDTSFMRFLSFIGKFEVIGAHYGGKHWKVKDNCIKCGKCVTNCPTHNITFKDGRFSFDNRCVLCLKCSFNCPVQAFTHKQLGSRFWIKPYDLRRILSDNSIAEIDFKNKLKPIVNRFRLYWQAEGIITESLDSPDLFKG